MKINVNFKGKFIDVFETTERQVELEEGRNVRDLLNLLCENNEDRRKNIFDSSVREIKPNVTVTRNGRFIIHQDWLDTRLADNDNIIIFTIHAGG